MRTRRDDRPAPERHAGVLDALRAVLDEAHVPAASAAVPAFRLRAADDPFDGEPAPDVVRRRRASMVAQREARHAEFVLVENADGVLLWRSADEVAVARTATRRRGPTRRRGHVSIMPRPWAEELARVRMPRLEANEYLARLAAMDDRLNRDAGLGLRRVVRAPDGRVVAGPRVQGPFAGRTLLFVHGTFSHATSLLDGLARVSTGAQWLAAAVDGGYDQVLCFEQRTLSVSPWVNALDLSRAIGATGGRLDVIAHSRGGVVVRWWLEVLGHALAAAGADVRVLLAGSPLAGTSLAAPDKIQPLASLLTNIGGLLAKTLGGAAAAHPFTLAGFALLELLGGRVKQRLAIPPVDDLGKRGSLDAAVALVPGLHGQSMVANNDELTRLRALPGVLAPRYHAVIANFEPEDPGLAFWKYFRKAEGAEFVMDRIFPEANDLVVDTASMTDLGPGRGAIPEAQVLRFGDRSGVWHCTYFEQPKTVGAITRAFAGP